MCTMWVFDLRSKVNLGVFISQLLCMRSDFSLGRNAECGSFMKHLEDVEDCLSHIVYYAGENVDN